MTTPPSTRLWQHITPVVAALFGFGCESSHPPIAQRGSEPWVVPQGFEVRAQTQYIRLWSDDDVTLCAGTVKELDQQVELGLSILDVDPADADPIDLVLSRDLSAVSPCDDCYVYALDVAFVKRTPLRHELSHAVMARRADPSNFLQEGFAEALSREGRAGEPTTSIVDDYLIGAKEYGNSRMMVQWLLTNHDHLDFQSLIDSQHGIAQYKLTYWPVVAQESLVDAYEWNLDDLVDEMAETMPPRFLIPYGQSCSGVEVDQLPGPLIRWGFSVALDCSSEHTRSLWPYDREDSSLLEQDELDAINSMTRRHTLDLPMAGTYRIATEAPFAVVRPCVAGDGRPTSPTWWGPELYAPIDSGLQFNHVEFEVTEPGTVTLDVGGTTDGPSSYWLSLILVAPNS